MATLTTIDSLAQVLFPRRKTFVSLKEVAEATSLSIRSVRRLCEQGRLSASKVNGRLLVSQDSFDEFLRSI